MLQNHINNEAQAQAQQVQAIAHALASDSGPNQNESLEKMAERIRAVMKRNYNPCQHGCGFACSHWQAATKPRRCDYNTEGEYNHAFWLHHFFFHPRIKTGAEGYNGWGG